jgi:hypothetical protein
VSDRTIDVLFLLALPAAGKSEVRRYLASRDARERREELGLGELVELDDYPYVHAMRRIDEELAKLGRPTVFFASEGSSFADTREWGTLAALLDEDFADATAARRARPSSPGDWLLDRFDTARQRIGAAPLFATKESRGALVDRMAAEAVEILAAKNGQIHDQIRDQIPESLAGPSRTIIIELSRGGPAGASMPLAPPRGYRHSLALFADAVLERARILYVWVTPEESRRKNIARAVPDLQGSILHHGVPATVMRDEYGCDDFGWLMDHAGRPDAVCIDARGRSHYVPTFRFDNRTDRTSFLRGDPAAWPPSAVKELHTALREGLGRLRPAPSSP